MLACYELTPGRSAESTTISDRVLFDDSFQFDLLFGGNRELIQRLLKIVQERLPLVPGNLQMDVRVRH